MLWDNGCNEENDKEENKDVNEDVQMKILYG